MSNGWTPERKAKQAEAIRRWKPWEQSTGAKSVEGKAASSMNAWKGGHRTKWRDLLRRMNKLLRSQKEALER